VKNKSHLLSSFLAHLRASCSNMLFIPSKS
jgi:hypothetical protein